MAGKTDTPMIRHFFEVKAQHPEAILLYRVGDFYETYSDDAVTASKILGLVLTARTNGDAGKIHMAGFPHHAIDTYLPKLVRAGYKVAVCDQLEDPKLVKNKLVKRGVTELVTPGIAFNESMLEQKENNFLAGLYFEGDKVGAAFLDVSTGMFQVTQGSLDYIKTLFASMSPKEMIVQRGYERGVKERFSDKIYLTSLDEWAFVYDSAVNKLCKQLGVNSLKGFAVERYPLGVCAAGALVNYLEQTLHEGLRNICSISRIDENKFVWMDSFTLNNLEVLHSQSREGTSLIDIMDRCVSPMGARMLHGWLGRPVLDIKELNSRYDTVQFFLDNPDERNEVRARIADIGDLERIISRAAAGKIAPREALKLGGGLSQIEPIRDLCSGEKAPQSLVDTAKTLRSCAPLIKKITETLAENAAAAIGKGD
ncbi:MAG: DNA mismatch repair protein MutS, partial [Bacteroidales bacterium]|nr:DNA mismatch repair protein MutS [Bacteroidales bacterium]